LEVCSQLDMQYKASRNQRLLIELGLMKMSNLLTEKKKSEPELSEPELSKESKEETPTNDSKASIRSNEEEKAEEEKTDEVESANKTAVSREIEINDPPATSGNIKRNLVRSSGISIKDALNPNAPDRSSENENDTKHTEAETDPDEEIITDFTEEELSKAWLSYAEKIKEEKPRIYISLTNRTPLIKDNYKIEVHLENESQIDDFTLSVKPYLQNHLIRELKNTSIQIESVLKKEESNGKKLYTSQDKFNYLSNKNPDLIKLKQEFNLDFD